MSDLGHIQLCWMEEGTVMIEDYKLSEQLKYYETVHIWSNEVRLKLIRQLIQRLKKQNQDVDTNMIHQKNIFFGY